MRFLPSLLLAFITTNVGSQAQSVPPAIPFRSIPRIPVIVPVSVNGIGPFDFILDTGSSSTTIDTALMQRLNLLPSATTSVTTLTGHSRVIVAYADTVTVGSQIQSHVELLVRDLLAPGIAGQNVRGILGENFLRNTDYLIDQRHHTLQFDPAGTLLTTLKGEPLSTTILTIPRSPGYTHMLVQAHVVLSADGTDVARPVTLLLDSGASSLILAPQALGTAPLPATSSSPTYIEDDNGRRKFVSQASVRVWLGSHSLKTWASETDCSFPGWTVDGFLPTAGFNSIYISNSAGFLLINPAHFRHHPPDTALAIVNRRDSPAGAAAASLDSTATPRQITE